MSQIQKQYTMSDVIEWYAMHRKWVSIEPVLCGNCNKSCIPNVDFIVGNKGFKATCPTCNGYIKFLPYTSVIMEKK